MGIWFLDTLVDVHVDGEATDGRLRHADVRGADRPHAAAARARQRGRGASSCSTGELTVHTADGSVVLGPRPGRATRRPASRTRSR
jgi:hypothetical protein